MTSEQNVPEVESHQGSAMSPGQQDGEAQSIPHNVQHGMGQSKSSRRRRRKRKNKSLDAQQGAQPAVAMPPANEAPVESSRQAERGDLGVWNKENRTRSIA